MVRVTVLYEERSGLDGLCLIPVKMIIRLGKGNIRWDETSIYFPIHAPFEQQQMDYFDEEILSMTIIQPDLIRNFERPDQFGIYIPFVLERIEQISINHSFNFDYYDIEQFIIQVDDLEEILQMNIRRIYEWRY